MELSPEQIFQQSAYRLKTIARMVEVNNRTLFAWIFNDVNPMKKNQEKHQKALEIAKSKRAIPFNKSFGYTTPEQFKQLSQLPHGEARNKLVYLVEFQNKNNGKYL
jgi:hypothetical protein